MPDVESSEPEIWREIKELDNEKRTPCSAPTFPPRARCGPTICW